MIDATKERDAAWHDAANAFQRLLLATHDPACAPELSPTFAELRTQAVRLFARAQERHRMAGKRELFPCAINDGMTVQEVP